MIKKRRKKPRGVCLLSICTPTYEMNNKGHIFLEHSFKILLNQTFKDFEIVISDHSKTDVIKNLCRKYKDKLSINYIKNLNNIGNSSANTNNAIKNAKGKLIKILFQDDFLYSKNSLKQIVKKFNLKKDKWLITACEHSKDGVNFHKPFYPRYHNKIHLGKNTISSPSVLTIKNENPLLFDENLIWLMDCDYYKRCYEKFGKPKILKKINVVNRVGKHQVSNTKVSENIKNKEYDYILKKYNEKRLQLKNVTLVAISSIKIAETIKALEQSMTDIDYGEVLLISHKKPTNLSNKIKFRKCPNLKNVTDYSKFIVYNLSKYINTDFTLIVQYDGYVIRPHRWNNEFLKYDYIGAPWPKNKFFTNEGINIRVGNGGFSMRSKELLNVLNKLNLPFTDNGTGFYHEDGIICNYYRRELEDYGIKFAPVEIASKFSRELDCYDSHPKPFGFHKNKKLIPKSILDKKQFKKKYMNIPLNTKILFKKILNKLRRVFFLRYKKKLKTVILNKQKIKDLISNNNPVILEIGSANGDDTLEFINIFSNSNLTLYGFEPEPKNINILKKRIFDKKYKLFEGVVSDIDGELIFNRSRSDNPDSLSFSGSIMKPKNHLKIWDWIYFDETIKVVSITLDSFCKKNNIKIIDFIWCDSQGAEEKIIQGGQNTFKNKVRYFYTEYCDNEQYEDQPKLKRILELLPSFEIIKDFGTDVLLKNKNL